MQLKRIFMKEIQTGQFISKYLHNYLEVSLFLLAGTIFGVETDMLADLICTSMVSGHTWSGDIDSSLSLLSLL